MKNFHYIGVCVIIVILALLVGMYRYFSESDTTVPRSDALFGAASTAGSDIMATVDVTEGEEKTDTSEPRKVPPGWKEYNNETYNFSLFYPQGLLVKEYPEGGDASTIVFENSGEARGFQIFVVPYSGSQVSEARFMEDVPSGVREQVTNIKVDGATAAAFYSTHTLLGETREVWFVYNGFLYELTTLKPLDTWLDEVIQTWKFL